MSSSNNRPPLKAGSVSFPILNMDWKGLKAFLDSFVKGKISVKTTPHTRYMPSDFFLVHVYSSIARISIDQSSQLLEKILSKRNTKKGRRKIIYFKDKKRHRRLVPHQTDVNKFIRQLSENDVNLMMKGALDYINQYIFNKIVPDRTWTSMTDNTKDAYYGAKDPLKHIGSNHLPGTKVCWMTQAVSVQSEDLHLFTDIFSLTKGVYRAKDVPLAIEWQKWCGINIKGIVFDREFYRAALVAELYKYNIRCIFPTKKYQWVKHHMENYLNGIGPLVVGNIFSQTNLKYPNQQSAFVRMVIVGKDGQKPWEIREDYQNGRLNLAQAMQELCGFFTNYVPWKNKKAWSLYICRTYKRRWNIETGFRVLNNVHESRHARTYTAKLFDSLSRMIVYNWWQAWAFINKKNKRFTRDSTLNEFRAYGSEQILSIISA